MAVSNVIMQKMRNEMKDSNFISIILDDTTDVSNKSQLSFILRYCTKDNKVLERFIGFIDIGNSRSADALYDTVQRIVIEYSCETKLVAQSYDGAAVMAGHLNGLQSKIRQTYPHAIFIHCMAHRLNLVLSQSTC